MKSFILPVFVAVLAGTTAHAEFTPVLEADAGVYRQAINARLEQRHKYVPESYQLEWARNIHSRVSTSLEYIQSNALRFFNRSPERHIKQARISYEKNGKQCTRAIRFEVLDEDLSPATAENIKKVNLGFENCRRPRQNSGEGASQQGENSQPSAPTPPVEAPAVEEEVADE